MSDLTIFIPCNIPTVTAQQKGASFRNGKVRFFKKKGVLESEHTFHALFYPHRPKTPFTGPVCLILHLRFPWRKSEKKSRIRKYSLYPVEVRPDLSNLVKTIEDVLTTLRFWNDDSQVSSLTVSKKYSDNPGIHLNITNDLAMGRHGSMTDAL